MHGWLVIHNHFFANTADISYEGSTSETGVLKEFPVSWKGVPEMVLSGSIFLMLTYIGDRAAPYFLSLSSLSLECSLCFSRWRCIEPCWKTAFIVGGSRCKLEFSCSLLHNRPLVCVRGECRYGRKSCCESIFTNLVAFTAICESRMWPLILYVISAILTCAILVKIKRIIWCNR